MPRHLPVLCRHRGDLPWYMPCLWEFVQQEGYSNKDNLVGGEARNKSLHSEYVREDEVRAASGKEI